MGICPPVPLYNLVYDLHKHHKVSQRTMRHADQMTTTGVGNGIEDEPGSMAVEPEWRLDRQGDSADQSYP